MESCQQEAGRTGAHTGFSVGSHSQRPAGLTGSCDLRPSAEKSLFWQRDKGASLVRCDLQVASLCGAPHPAGIDTALTEVPGVSRMPPKPFFPWLTPCARSSSPGAGIPRLWGFQECCGQPLLLCVHPRRCCNSAAKFSSWGLPGRGPHQTPPIPAHRRTKHWCSLPLTSISRPKLHKMLKRSKTLLGPVVLGFAPRSFQAGSFAPNPSVSQDAPVPLRACPPGTCTGGAGRGWPRSWHTG